MFDLTRCAFLFCIKWSPTLQIFVQCTLFVCVFGGCFVICSMFGFAYCFICVLSIFLLLICFIGVCFCFRSVFVFVTICTVVVFLYVYGVVYVVGICNTAYEAYHDWSSLSPTSHTFFS